MKVGLFLVAILINVNMLALSEHSGPNPIMRTIECRIIDAATGEALTGVQISVDGSNLASWSDEEGKCTLQFPTSGQSKLTCSLVSFETISLELSNIQEEIVIFLHEK
jgi:hypothetical protein